jgi:hypothetical protein
MIKERYMVKAIRTDNGEPVCGYYCADCIMDVTVLLGNEAYSVKEETIEPVAVKVIYDRDRLKNRTDNAYWCPNCEYGVLKNFKYCCKCGQYLDWSDVE